MLLGENDALSVKIDQLTGRIEALIAAMPAAQAPPSNPPSSDGGPNDEQPPLPAMERLDEITGIGMIAAQTIIAEVGLDMTRFPTAGIWSRGPSLRPAPSSPAPRAELLVRVKATPISKACSGKQRREWPPPTPSWRALPPSRQAPGVGKAQVAVARSILVIVWQLLANPSARYRDLGPGFYAARVNTERKVRNLVHQLEALGHTVTLAPTA